MLEYSARSLPRDTFRYALGEDAPEVAKLMPELRRIFPGIPPALELPPEQQRRFLFNAYREFVERSARLAPIVALFEDLHWEDEPTLLLLQHLAQAVSRMPMLIIGTYRDVELEIRRSFAKSNFSNSYATLWCRTPPALVDQSYRSSKLRRQAHEFKRDTGARVPRAGYFLTAHIVLDGYFRRTMLHGRRYFSSANAAPNTARGASVVTSIYCAWLQCLPPSAPFM